MTTFLFSVDKSQSIYAASVTEYEILLKSNVNVKSANAIAVEFCPLASP